MRRLLAVALVVLGLGGLLLGRLGETVWAPETERTAAVQLDDSGPAVVIDPGVVYVGGHEGTLTVTGPADVSVISAPKDDVAAYLGDTRHTEITGVPDWATLTAKDVSADGDATLPDPAGADLWRTVRTSASPAEISLAELWKADGGAKPAQPYQAILIVTDGTQPAATEVSVTWPVEAANAWVPYAYVIGAVLAVLGLVLFVIDFSAARTRRQAAEDELDAEAADTAAVETEAVETSAEPVDAPAEDDDAPAEGAVAAPAEAAASEDDAADASRVEETTETDPASAEEEHRTRVVPARTGRHRALSAEETDLLTPLDADGQPQDAAEHSSDPAETDTAPEEGENR